MSQKTIGPVIAVASLLASPLVAQDSTEPPPIQLVNVVDVAELEFTPAPERVEDWEAWPATWTNDFFLVVEESGKPIHCEPFASDADSPLSARLCADLIANARINLLEGFGLGGRQGVVALSKQPFRALPGYSTEAQEAAMREGLKIVELAPDAFTDYEPMREFEKVRTEGLEMRPPPGPPTYPRSSLGLGHEGSTGTVIGVDEEGKAISCRPVESSGFGKLDSAACRFILDQATFDVSGVAEDAPAPYYYPMRITWRIPE